MGIPGATPTTPTLLLTHVAGTIGAVNNSVGVVGVSPMTVPVAEANPVRAVLAANDVQIGMRSAPRVDDRDGDVPGIRRIVRADLSVDPVDAGWQRLRDGFDGPVFGDERHSGIAPNVTEPRWRDRRGVSLQRAVIELRDARTVRPAMRRR